jgi:hypothetical protein
MKMPTCLYALQTKLVQMVKSKLGRVQVFLFYFCLSSKYFLLNLQDTDEVLEMAYVEYIVAYSN